MKNSIKSLKRDAEVRLSLDVETQQSFEFLSDQLHGLRQAFSCLSDVLVEEIDLLRADAVKQQGELDARLTQLIKGHKAAKPELAMLRSQFDDTKFNLETRVATVEERVEGMGEDLTLLAHEVAKGTSAQHLLQLEVVELRSALEHEAHSRREGHEAPPAAAREHHTPPRLASRGLGERAQHSDPSGGALGQESG